MKKILIIVLLSLPFVLQAQQKRTHEIGLNASPFLSSFVSIGQTEFTNPHVAFTWKRVKPNGNTIRLGIGYNLKSFTGFSEPFRNKFRLQMGFEKRYSLMNNWQYYWGADGVLNIENLARGRSLVGEGIGLGPIFGIIYNLNDKMSLSTESTLYIIFSSETTMSFIPPTSLFFNLKFVKNNDKRLERQRKKLERIKRRIAN